MYLVIGSLLQIVLKITSRKICCAADEAFTDSSFVYNFYGSYVEMAR